ncbi:hypothetical protein BS47DRAFT_1373218 [Hydnum rufescens UP504]|uniref:Eukaryotic translation initiation factor 3 subunit A n=1 Tax=Hydnum rufescens UP504 TaxID=1448309 RepID=A0A9P6DTS2_9AGAM|nr:hypothetical protein BS47DRAFT_1373218 [Hydnum rufescens UP504]
MAPFTKPETVLKQAEGLVQVGQSNAALQSLTEMFSSKRFRSTPLTSLEPIMLRFVELCVDMRRGRTAKEGLMQYKNIAQNSSVTSIEVVIKKFIALSDAKVQEAQEQAERVIAVDVDDLEASETPEDVLLGAVSGDQNKDRTDRALVTPWLKFSWESYRTALETLKNNARLEAVYQQIALQAFKFCLKHSRKVEFRRLCETLRLHLANVAKYSHQTHSINLSDPDTLQRHLDTRFAQLNASVELELWQEAFRSVEDVHNLLTLAKKAPRPAMMANYYEKLTRIFLTSGNALYHAAAWSRYYSVVRAVGGKSEEELAQLGGLVLISALAIPVSLADGEEEEVKGKSARLTALLGLSKPPTRTSLLRDALLRNALNVSSPEIRLLHQILEVDLHPLTICATIAPIFRSLAADSTYAPYLSPLNKVLLSRLLGQLSQVYSSVRLTYITELIAPLNEPYDINPRADGVSVEPEIWDSNKLEAYMMGCARRGELSIRIDHAEGSVTFASDVFGGSSPVASTSSTGAVPCGDLIRTRFSRLATTLSNSLLQLYPPPATPSAAEEYATLFKAAEEERKRLAIRRTLTTRRAELLSELSVRKEKEEQSRKAEQARKDKEEENRRALEGDRRRAQERLKRELEAARKEEAKTLAKTLIAKGGLKVDAEDIEKYDTTKLVALQVEQLDKEKRDFSERLRILHKRIDHLERAFRKEERPLLEQDYERQQQEDHVTHEMTVAMRRAAAQQKHREDLEAKARLSRIMADYQARCKEITDRRQEDYERRRAEAQKLIDAEKEVRRKKVFAERAAQQKSREIIEARLRSYEEELRQRDIGTVLFLLVLLLNYSQADPIVARKEEEESSRAEAEAAAAKEEAAKRAAEEQALEARKLREAERRKTAEEARLKLQKEEEAERHRLERQAARPSNGDVAASTWRRSGANSGTSTPTSSIPPSSGRPTPTLGGAYRPPALRAASGANPVARTAAAGDVTPPLPASKPSPFGQARPRQDISRQGTPPPRVVEKDADGFQTATPKFKVRRTGPGEAPPR